MAKYVVNWPLHGLTKGSEHKQGDVVSVDPEQAAPLVKFGVLSPQEAEQAAPQTNGGKEQGDGGTPDDLVKKSKAEIAKHAKEKLGIDLDPNALTKDAMLAQIAEALSK